MRAGTLTSAKLLATVREHRHFQQDYPLQKVYTNTKFNSLKRITASCPHHGSWNRTAQQFINEHSPAIIIQSTSLSHHRYDKWGVPTESKRYTTTIDDTIRLMLNEAGQIRITTKHFLDSMVE